MSRPPSAAHRTLSALLVTLLLTAIGWQALRLLRAADRARYNPDGALALDATQGEAHYRRARNALRDDPAHAEPLIRAALAAAPGDARLYALLARARDVAGAREEALALYALALRDEPANYVARVGRSDLLLRLGRYDEAVADLAVLLRTHAGVRPGSPAIDAALLAVAADPRGTPAVARWMAGAGAAREPFLVAALGQLEDARVADALYAALETAKPPASATERAAYLAYLMRTERWQEAWLLWAGALDATQRDVLGNVYDGGFELPPDGSGFGWRFDTVGGAAIERVAPGAEGAHALAVTFFDQRVPFQHVAQPLLLSAGPHRLSGRVRSDDLRGSRGVVWRVRCADRGRTLIGESERQLGSADWHDFAFAFEVPATDCAAQWLQLEVAARAPVEQDLGGRVLFDGLVLARQPTVGSR